jgi:putative transposase
MARHARVVFPDVPHHVTQRGIHRSTVFIDHSDGIVYLDLLRQYIVKHGVEIVAYCLMPNHVHLVLVPADETGLHRTLKAVHGRYAQRFNRIRDRVGHLWQNRYFSSPMDSDYFRNAVRYVELNPVRANLVQRADEYPWSSAAAHSGRRQDPLVSARPDSTLFRGISDWAHWLGQGLSDECLETLRTHTNRNLPCGSEAFVRRLEIEADRMLRPRPRGRPARPPPPLTIDAPFLEKVNVPN